MEILDVFHLSSDLWQIPAKVCEMNFEQILFAMKNILLYLIDLYNHNLCPNKLLYQRLLWKIMKILNLLP